MHLGGERRVSTEQKQEDYLTKAREADVMAEKAKDVLTRDAWRKIAQNYRVLAGVKDEGAAVAPASGRAESR